MTAPGGTAPPPSRPWVWAKELPAERWCRLAAFGLLGAGALGLTTRLVGVWSGGPLASTITGVSALLLTAGVTAALLRIPGVLCPHEWARLFWMEYRECPTCRETLDGLGDEGSCPGCGQGYDLAWLRNVWRTRYPVPEFADVQKAIEERGLVEGRGPERTRASQPVKRKTLVALGALAVVMVAVLAIVFPRLGGGPLPGMILSWATGGAIGAFIGPAVRARLSPARAVALGFRVCPSCRFDLRGLPDAGNCPECRSRYTVKHLRATWIVRVPRTVNLEGLREAYFKQHPGEMSPAPGSPPPGDPAP